MTTSLDVFGISKDDLPASDTRLNRYINTNHQQVPGSERILVMDDEEALLDLVSILLSHFGFRPVVARHGEEAVGLYKEAAAENDPIALVIMDLTIPEGLGGRETLARLQEFDPYVTAVVSSGYSTDPVVENFRQYGFAGILTKPYTAQELNDLIRKVLSAKREKTTWYQWGSAKIG